GKPAPTWANVYYSEASFESLVKEGSKNKLVFSNNPPARAENVVAIRRIGSFLRHFNFSCRVVKKHRPTHTTCVYNACKIIPRARPKRAAVPVAVLQMKEVVHDAMMEAYLSADCYLTFARQAGEDVPIGATEKSHPHLNRLKEIRATYKVVVLATQYGQTCWGSPSG